MGHTGGGGGGMAPTMAGADGLGAAGAGTTGVVGDDRVPATAPAARARNLISTLLSGVVPIVRSSWGARVTGSMCESKRGLWGDSQHFCCLLVNT